MSKAARKTMSDISDADLMSLFNIDTDATDAKQQLYQSVKEQKEILEHYARAVDRLSLMLERLEYAISAIRLSRAWRVGFRLMSVVKKLLGRKAQGDGFQSIDETLEHYHHWKKSWDISS